MFSDLRGKVSQAVPDSSELSNLRDRMSQAFTSSGDVIKYPVTPVVVKDAKQIPPPWPRMGTGSPSALYDERQRVRSEACASSDATMNGGMSAVFGGNKNDSNTNGRQAQGSPGPLSRVFGIADVARGAVGVAYHRSAATIANSLHNSSENRDAGQFNKEFKTLVAEHGSILLSRHQADVMNGGQRTQVSLYVTTTHVCFANDNVRDAIPYSFIKSLQPGLALPQLNSAEPYVQWSVPASQVVPSAICIFTDALQCYQFVNFNDSIRMTAAHMDLRDIEPCVLAYYAVEQAWWAAKGPRIVTTRRSSDGDTQHTANGGGGGGGGGGGVMTDLLTQADTLASKETMED